MPAFGCRLGKSLVFGQSQDVRSGRHCMSDDGGAACRRRPTHAPSTVACPWMRQWPPVARGLRESAYIGTGGRLARRRRAVSHTGDAGRASRYNDRDRAFGTPCETQGHCPAARLHLLATRCAGTTAHRAPRRPEETGPGPGFFARRGAISTGRPSPAPRHRGRTRTPRAAPAFPAGRRSRRRGLSPRAAARPRRSRPGG